MRYSRSAIVFQQLSSVLTETIYYEQMILTGLYMEVNGTANKTSHFAVDPTTGVECTNARCVAHDMLSDADILAQQQASNNQNSLFSSLSSSMAVENAKEVWLSASAADPTNR
jgi:hypothetical protein